MMLVIKLLVNTLAIFIAANLLPGVKVNDLATAFLVAIVLAGINTFIKPIIMLFALPINLLTLGLFSFVINGVIILIASYIVDGFAVPDFWHALLFGFVLSMVSSVLIWLVK